MNSKKRLLFTGISGFFGWHFSKNLPEKWEVHGVANRHPGDVSGVQLHRIDLTRYRDVKAAMKEIRPDAVIHAAAMANPNRCEQYPVESYAINVEATRQLAGLCADIDITFLFTSTDLVFDGDHPPYSEDDEPDPINVYGEHKARAEELVRGEHPDALIVRLPLMFGDPGPVAQNFYAQMVQKLAHGDPISLFADEYRSMISGEVAIRGMVQMLGNTGGILHLAGTERVSRYEFGVLLAEALGASTGYLARISQADISMAAARPRDVTLVSHRAADLGWNPPPLPVQIRRSLQVV